MPTLQKITGGRLAKRNGKVFEQFLKNCALEKHFEVIHIRDGCERVGAHKLVQVSQPFDMVLAKKGKVVFLDAKSISGKFFARSWINLRQALPLSRLEENGFLAGYVIFFTTVKKVAFFSAGHLMRLKQGDSLSPEQGVIIGDDKNINFDLLIESL